MTSTPRILILYAHPAHGNSRVNRRLREHVEDIPHVQVHDLYEMYPDFHIDVAHEQRMLEQSELIVFQHPVQWYSMPALLKEWIDVVFEHGWAYGHDGHALQGKDLWLVATTGGPAAAYQPDGYHRRNFSDFLPPYEQTAQLCGLRWLPPLIVHGSRRASDAEMAPQAQLYRERLLSYPAWSKECVAPSDRDPIAPELQPGNPHEQ
ncbi:NAD(P)H-dependent oxidoreductase [Noviherbaspirillum saxi]|uniref:NAD(P)H dehydrogenase n=1 Tax=Noviherbaspirillum saxi TaxID=2320863 RepID=A0A3A3FNY0_9BURK|nr:NAD(P)H-dependent oxidoreductase [Noviherbaspirillum saxi]RJF95389.1 NAD(P)H dehydrogenase [Noviherbaspirillum saxi]